MTPVLLPSDLQLIISRELEEGEWEFEHMMEVIERETAARELSAGALMQPMKRQGTSTKPPSTALSLVTGVSNQVTCAYCNQPHSSNSCQTVTNIEDRKCILRTTWHCFIYLKWCHVSQNCRSSSSRCNKCCTSICFSINSRAEHGNPKVLPTLLYFNYRSDQLIMCHY